MHLRKKLTENEARLIAAIKTLQPATVATALAYLRENDLEIPHSSAHAAAITLIEKKFIRSKVRQDGTEVYYTNKAGLQAARIHARRQARLVSMIDQPIAGDLSELRIQVTDGGLEIAKSSSELQKSISRSIEEIKELKELRESQENKIVLDFDPETSFDPKFEVPANPSLLSKFRFYIRHIFYK